MDKNKFAQTPPMGWNSYDYYDTSVNEEQVKANADYMAAHLKQYGWEYVVVDIQWYAYGAGSMRDKHQYIPFSKLEMDEYGRLLPCPERFPSAAGGAGFRPLADYIHSLGLKFGIHIMRGIPRAAAQQHLPVLGSSQTADEIANPSSICGWNPDMYGCAGRKKAVRLTTIPSLPFMHSGVWIMSNAMISATLTCIKKIRIPRPTKSKCFIRPLKKAAGPLC